MKEILNILSLWLIPVLVCIILIHALIKKTPCYEVFVDGAKEGLFVAIKILPYLVAIIVSVSMFRASGAIEFLSQVLSDKLQMFNVPTETLPLMLTRSMSGSATLGIFSDIVNSSGVDSYASKLSAIIVGSSETTFYVLAVYFGSVKISKYRYALLSGLAADFIGIAAAVLVCQMFF